MPIHDWTRVNAGLFHHFHVQWISALCNALNAGCLPEGYYALAAALAPPRTRFVRQAEVDPYAARAHRIAIRHPLGQVVAIVEIVSP